MPGVESFLDKYIPDSGDIAIDVGANLGVWSEWLATRFATVYAIEPHPILQSRWSCDLPNVRLLPFGAWDRTEQCIFTVFSHHANTSVVNGWGGILAGEPLSTFEADCLPIDDIGIGSRVDFIKIDAEAAEYEVLLGATATVQRDRPHMVIEVHSAASGERVKALLTEWGYRWTFIRHPYYAPDSPWWNEHYWLACEGGD